MWAEKRSTTIDYRIGPAQCTLNGQSDNEIIFFCCCCCCCNGAKSFWNFNASMTIRLTWRKHTPPNAIDFCYPKWHWIGDVIESWLITIVELCENIQYRYGFAKPHMRNINKLSFNLRNRLITALWIFICTTANVNL